MRSRQLNFWQLSIIVAMALLVHWVGMNLIVQWCGGEANIARGQAVVHSSVPAYQHDDGWRRTSHGWERIDKLPPPVQPLATTHHFSLSQFWPAAWAAGMVLLIYSAPSREDS